MKLKPRTTYRNSDGWPINIAGLAKRDVEGKACWWSIQGDHYTEDGRFVHTRRRDVAGQSVFESFTIDNDRRSLVSEDTSEQAQRWWDGVKT